MKTPLLLATPLTVLLWSAARGAPEDGAPLTAEDRQFLGRLLQDFLFDPRGAERVLVKTSDPQGKDEWREGWRVAGAGGIPGRVCFTDGESVLLTAVKESKKVDFVDVCRRWLAEAGAAGIEDDDGRRRRSRPPEGAAERSDLVLAAWLHCLGHDDLAARALALAQANEETEAVLRARLASESNDRLLDAYAARADEAALVHGERLLRLFAEEARQKYPQARAVLAKAARGKKKGASGKLPDGFDAWEISKRSPT
jgi:hypothetical protein